MRFVDLLRITVLLSAGAATALAIVTVLGATAESDDTVVFVLAAWWFVAALIGAFLGAIAHVWWYEGVKAVGPSRAAIFMNLQPVVGVVLAWAMLHEAVEWPEVVGGALVLLGVALTTQAPLASRKAS